MKSRDPEYMTFVKGLFEPAARSSSNSACGSWTQEAPGGAIRSFRCCPSTFSRTGTSIPGCRRR
jgi:hypothetical protein